MKVEVYEELCVECEDGEGVSPEKYGVYEIRGTSSLLYSSESMLEACQFVRHCDAVAVNKLEETAKQCYPGHEWRLCYEEMDIDYIFGRAYYHVCYDTEIEVEGIALVYNLHLEYRFKYISRAQK